MAKKIIVVGGVAGGASVAARARRLDEKAEVVMFEKGPNVSFSNCALPYHLSGTIPDADSIVLMDPPQFKAQYNIDAVVNHEVTGIDPKKQTVTVKNVLDDTEESVAYDELVLSPGAEPIRPKSIAGVDGENVFTMRNVVDIKKIKSYLDEKKVETVSVIGGGFIGIETAENLIQGGYKVNLIEGMDHVLGTIDYDMAQIIQKTMLDHGINLLTSETVTKITPDSVKLASGKSLPSQAVVLSVGVLPDTRLATQVGAEIGKTGGIKVDQGYQTTVPHIYAVGDAVEVQNRITPLSSRPPFPLHLHYTPICSFWVHLK